MAEMDMVEADERRSAILGMLDSFRGKGSLPGGMLKRWVELSASWSVGKLRVACDRCAARSERCPESWRQFSEFLGAPDVVSGEKPAFGLPTYGADGTHEGDWSTVPKSGLLDVAAIMLEFHTSAWRVSNGSSPLPDLDRLPRRRRGTSEHPQLGDFLDLCLSRGLTSEQILGKAYPDRLQVSELAEAG